MALCLNLVLVYWIRRQTRVTQRQFFLCVGNKRESLLVANSAQIPACCRRSYVSLRVTGPEGAYYWTWNLYFQSLAVFMLPVFSLPFLLYSLSECVKDLLENSNLSQLTIGSCEKKKKKRACLGKQLFVLDHVVLVFYFWKIIRVFQTTNYYIRKQGNHDR